MQTSANVELMWTQQGLLKAHQLAHGHGWQGIYTIGHAVIHISLITIHFTPSYCAMFLFESMFYVRPPEICSLFKVTHVMSALITTINDYIEKKVFRLSGKSIPGPHRPELSA